MRVHKVVKNGFTSVFEAASASDFASSMSRDVPIDTRTTI
jgi:hypothetical protein